MGPAAAIRFPIRAGLTNGSLAPGCTGGDSGYPGQGVSDELRAQPRLCPRRVPSGAPLTPPLSHPALKKSFEAEDTEDVDEVPGSPAASPLPSGAVESHRLLQPSPAPRMGSGPSPSHSPLLRSRLSASLAANRGPSGSGIARVASFQTRPGPGSDGESLRSSSSSLESPAPPRPPGAPPATSPGLKKVPSHGSVFPAEPERPLHVATGHGSLPALDLHIAEEPGVPPPASRPPLPWGARSPISQPRACCPSSPSSSSSPTEVAPGPPRTQLRVCLSASPRLARPPPRGPGDATLAATVATDPGEGLSMLPAPQAAPFKLVSQPQTVQVSSQPTFLGGLVLMSGTPAAPRDGTGTGPLVGDSSSASSVGPQGPSEAADGCCTPGTPEHGRSHSPMSLPSVPTGTPLLSVSPPRRAVCPGAGATLSHPSWGRGHGSARLTLKHPLGTLPLSPFPTCILLSAQRCGAGCFGAQPGMARHGAWQGGRTARSRARCWQRSRPARPRGAWRAFHAAPRH